MARNRGRGVARLAACAAALAWLSNSGAVAGELLVSSSEDDRVMRFDDLTCEPLGVAIQGGGLNLPWGIARGADGHLYVASFMTHSVLRYHGQTGAFLGVFVSSQSGGMVGPTALLWHASGDLLVASSYGSVGSGPGIRRFDGQTGALLGFFVAEGSGGLAAPEDMTYGPDGDLYVTNRYIDNVLRYDGQSGAFIEEFAVGAIDPQGLAFGPDGDLYVGSWFFDSIERYDGRTGEWLGTFVYPVSQGPIDLEFGPNGNLYVSVYNGFGVDVYDGATGEPKFPGAVLGDKPTGIHFIADPPKKNDPHLHLRSGSTGSAHL